MITNKKSSLYYKIIDALLSSKNDNYIRNDDIKIDDNINYANFIECVINTIVKHKKEKNNSHFIFEFKNNIFIIKELHKEQSEKYKNDHKQKVLSPNELLDFIKENTKSNNINIINNKEKEKSNKQKEPPINIIINKIQEKSDE